MHLDQISSPPSRLSMPKKKTSQNIYKNETATATTNPAPPANQLLLAVAPLVMLTGSSELEGVATTPPVPVAATTVLLVVPTEVGALKVEDAEEEERTAVEDGTEVLKVEVTDATTSETVMVLVIVWVEV